MRIREECACESWRIVPLLCPSSILERPFLSLFLSFRSLLPRVSLLRPLLFLLMGVRTRKCVRRTHMHTLARDTHILITNSCSRGLLLLASLWHQIPYSSQNGESASSRARWSTSERLSERDSHRTLLTGLSSSTALYVWEIFLKRQIPWYERLRICFHFDKKIFNEISWLLLIFIWWKFWIEIELFFFYSNHFSMLEFIGFILLLCAKIKF